MTSPGNSYRLATVAVLTAVLVTVAPYDSAPAGDANATGWLDGLIGSWAGRADTTPVGPRPYDMTFKRLADGRIAAMANPGRAIHHWWFSQARGRLHLTFLTTFQGNREPQPFLPATFESGKAIFTTRRADRLSVHVLLRHRRLAIDVLRHGRLHVAIRLNRTRTGD